MVRRKRFCDPNLERRFKTIRKEPARFEQIQAIGNQLFFLFGKRSLLLCGMRCSIEMRRRFETPALNTLAERLPEAGFIRTHQRRLAQAPTKAHFFKRKVNSKRHNRRANRQEHAIRAPFWRNFEFIRFREAGLRNNQMQTQMIFFVGIHRRDIDASAVCTRANFLCIRKDLVKQQ